MSQELWIDEIDRIADYEAKFFLTMASSLNGYRGSEMWQDMIKKSFASLLDSHEKFQPLLDFLNTVDKEGVAS